MSKLFEKTLINNMNLANRFVRSATWEGLADKDGSVTPKLINRMVELVEGEVGLIITGAAFIRAEGRSGIGQLAVHEDRFLPGLKKMVWEVHTAGGKICLQLAHGGIFSSPEMVGLERLCPSTCEYSKLPICRAMTQQDIFEITKAFARSAVLAKQAGFDAIQIHAGHGCLLSEFLSPFFNRRMDEYGGSLENRAKLLLEVVQSVREAIGTDYPVLVKLNSEDFLENGLTRGEAVQLSTMLEKASIDGIELSGGTMASPKTLTPSRPGDLKTPDDEVYYREAARLYKRKVSIPLIIVGGIRSFQVADELIESGAADYIALSRPLICEPGLVKRWGAGDVRKAECESDNLCFRPVLKGQGLYCVTREKSGICPNNIDSRA